MHGSGRFVEKREARASQPTTLPGLVGEMFSRSRPFNCSNKLVQEMVRGLEDKVPFVSYCNL